MLVTFDASLEFARLGRNSRRREYLAEIVRRAEESRIERELREQAVSMACLFALENAMVEFGYVPAKRRVL